MPVGVYVAQILENGGAASSDLREGDIITAINKQSISSMEELQKMLQYYKAGTEVTLTVQRQDGQGSYKEAEVKVTLGTRASIENQQQNDQQNGQQENGQQEQVDPNMPDQNGGQNGNNGQDGQNGYNGQSFEQFGFPFGN